MWYILIFVVFLVLGMASALGENKKGTKNAIERQNTIIETKKIHMSKDIGYTVAYKQKLRFVVDDSNKMVHFFTAHNQYDIPYDQLMGCELNYNGEIVGQTKRAIVGSILAGGTGAIIGALTAKKEEAHIMLKVFQNSISNPLICFELLNASEDGPLCAKDEGAKQQAVEFANEVIATINVILKNYQS